MRGTGIRSRRLRRKRASLLAIVALGSAALGIAGYETDAFRAVELDTVDGRFTIRGNQGPSPDVVVVQVDDKTFLELGLQWPFKRSIHGELIDRLRRDRARAIGYDVQFTEPSSPELGGVAEDSALVDAIDRAHGRVVLATTEVDEGGQSGIFGANGDQILRSVGARPGNTVLPQDPGGVFRRVPYSTQKLESFGLVLAETATKRKLRPGEVGEGWIDYAGKPGTVRAVSFSDALRGKVPPATFRNKIVVVGASAPTLQDLHATATSGDELMSGPEIQANAVDTALRGFPLQSADDWLNLLAIVLLALVAPIASLLLAPLRALALALAGGAVYLVVAQLAFNQGTVLTVVYALGALAVSIVGALGVHYAVAVSERVKLRDVFGRFVPEGVVEQVVERIDEDLRLGGEEAEATVLFSDLRGFTSFSETMPASRVIEVLNRYLASMSEAIRDHGGTLCSYLGDGILAVFGAPIPQPDHADRALAAAREMLGPQLARFNAELRAEGVDEGFLMGIGLNTGTVMAGNVGSEWRCEYTVIGDTVNTASRLEGMTKGTPHSLFFADATKEALAAEPDDLVYVDELPVRGRTGVVKLWSLSSTAKPAPAPEAQPTARAGR
jgi:adenylate cyclase